jgi:KaiC/GvpD/RAD55 family RecA-like ATPase
MEKNMERKRIPQELAEVLLSRRGYSLLIKGAPGTGKTILALEIIGLLRDSNAVYISSRVSPTALYEHFPWLDECLSPPNLIDATKLYVPSDAIPGVQTFPESLYLRLGKIEKPVTIVFDSWEATTSQMEGGRIETLETAITEWARHDGTKLILVSEKLGTSSLDYAVDGIVTLRRITMDSRRARELEIEKLRGVRIDQPRYAFTLEGGRFQYFVPFKRRKVEKPRKIELVSNTKNHVSTGITDLDRILGGFKKGSFNTINAGDDISLLGYQSIIAHIIINSIQQGNNCVCIPCCGWNEKRLRRGIMPFVKEEDYLKNLTIFEIGGEGKEEEGGNVRSLRGEMIKADISKFRNFISDLEPPVTVIIGADMLEYPYQLKERGKVEEMVSLLSNLMTDMREAGNVGVFGVIPGLELSEMLAHMSEVCINLWVLNKSVILYCNRPDTKLHCLENIITEDSLKINLTAFV